MDHNHFMQEAIKQAICAREEDEVPVGAVIVYKGKIIARAHNQNRLLKDPTAHAEIIAITQAADYLKSERLLNTAIYVTIEPCSMCTGALVLARVTHLIYGADDPKAGACGSVIDIARHNKLNHRLKITRGVLAEDCSALLQEFFKGKRGQPQYRG